MKLKVCLSFLMVLITVFSIGCGSRVSKVNGEVGLGDFKVAFNVEFVEKNKEKIPHGTFLEVRNSTDRNISLDLDGPSHYTVSIGDNRTRVLKVEPGSYKLRAAAPGLFYPSDNQALNFKEHSYYKITWVRGD